MRRDGSLDDLDDWMRGCVDAKWAGKEENFNNRGARDGEHLHSSNIYKVNGIRAFFHFLK